jgi:hypothetical protein
LHINASSRKILEISFSRANVRLLPSTESECNWSQQLSLSFEAGLGRRTDNQSEVFHVAGVTLTFDCLQSLVEEALGLVGGLLVNDDLKGKIESAHWMEAGRESVRVGNTTTYEVHGLGNQSTRQSDIDSGLLTISSKNPDLT